MIDVPIVTWPNHPKRLEYFAVNLIRLATQLTASEPVVFVISSESEADPKTQWLGNEMQAIARAFDVGVYFRSGSAGLGENMNDALRLCGSDLVFLVQDDHWLLEPLDLTAGAAFMRAHPEVDMIRYSWPGDDRVFLHDMPDGWRRFGFEVEGERGWPYGDDPCLRRGNFIEKFGPYLEAAPHGASEGDMLRRLRAANADIRAADRIYFGHAGAVPAAIHDLRPGHKGLRDG